MKIKEEKIIITGAAGGFGAHLADSLKDKAKKLILVDMDLKLPEKFREFPGVSCYICNLTDFKQTTNTINEIFVKDPDSGILINNAGKIHSELLINFLKRVDRRHSKETWDRMIDVNLTSVFNCSVNVIDHFIRNKTKGLVINISSISAGGNSGQSVYSAAKAGVNALTSVWSRELSMFGIRTAGIAPGFFDTPSTRAALKDTFIKKIISEIPSGRLGMLNELVRTVLFIIENDYLNGKIIELDGGMTLSHN